MVEAYPQDTGGKKITASFLYSVTRSLFEQAGFSYVRPKGKNHTVMRTTIDPAPSRERLSGLGKFIRPGWSTLGARASSPDPGAVASPTARLASFRFGLASLRPTRSR